MGLNYWRLSYRKKFIRTLWMTPFTIITMVLIYLVDTSLSLGQIFLDIILAGTWLGQLLYTYYKSKKEER